MINIKIIISPSKKMVIDNDTIVHRQEPIFLKESQILLDYLQNLSYEKLKLIWKCSDRLTRENFDRIKNMNLHDNLTPAILSFEGLQYQYMGAGTFTDQQLKYVEKNLRILSGFYGLLRPFDGIRPYRLEMQAKLMDWEYKTLYDLWGEKIAKSIFSESNCIINLASKEYSDSISKYLTKDIRFINCTFGELIDGRVIEKATLIKMARGEMVRFMAKKNIKEVEDIKKFDSLDYTYSNEFSCDNDYVFIKKN